MNPRLLAVMLGLAAFAFFGACAAYGCQGEALPDESLYLAASGESAYPLSFEGQPEDIDAQPDDFIGEPDLPAYEDELIDRPQSLEEHFERVNERARISSLREMALNENLVIPFVHGCAGAPLPLSQEERAERIRNDESLSPDVKEALIANLVRFDFVEELTIDIAGCPRLTTLEKERLINGHIRGYLYFMQEIAEAGDFLRGFIEAMERMADELLEKLVYEQDPLCASQS